MDQRARLIHCYKYWGKYNEAKAQGLYVLRFIRELYSETGKEKWKGGVSELGKDNKDKDLAMLIVEVVLMIVKCVANARCEDEADVVDMFCLRVCYVVDETESWLRIIDADAYEKLHKMLVTYPIKDCMKWQLHILSHITLESCCNDIPNQAITVGSTIPFVKWSSIKKEESLSYHDRVALFETIQSFVETINMIRKVWIYKSVMLTYKNLFFQWTVEECSLYIHLIIMENVPSPNNNPNVPEEEPILDQALVALDPDKNEKEDPKEEPKEEEIEDEDMVNDEEDDAEIADANDVPIPPVIQFESNFHMGESSAMKDLLAGNSEVYAPGPMYCDMKSVHRGVMKLSKQMHDMYRMEKKIARKLRQDELRMNGQEFDITALDLAVRENRSENSKMMKMITGLCREFTELKILNRRAKELSHWEAWVRRRIPNNLRFQEEPSIYTAYVPRADDPYIMVRDAAMDTQRDEDVDTDAP
uniref:Separase isoform X1 n=1 Tax=Tanacetum cinerariifolium TaxID=118510 RepID=A0A6L2N1R6_TANCI|nr:separase isoform X1 [Tanacetum cinerariifolium]